MAAPKYSATDRCACGNPLKVFALSGRTQKACGPGCYPRYPRKKAAAPRAQRPTHSCSDCGAPVWRYSKRCDACYRVAQLKASPNHFTCERCGTTAQRRKGGANKRKGYTSRWCSMRCKKAWHAESPAEHPFSAVHFKTCKSCGRSWVARRPDALYCSDECRYIAAKVAIEARACNWCGGDYQPISPTIRGGMPSRSCCDECAHAAHAVHKRVGKSKRKARIRRVKVENVDPFRVFDRDRWRCQLCGTKTPKRMRGTHKDNAPELDHIHPLAHGGEHSYLNTQCACRRCNQLKSSRPRGQMMLVG